MLLLNSLKVVSSETRSTHTVHYTPKDAVRRAFMLPRRIEVHIEVFPIQEMNAFQKAEPLYYIDGYLRMAQGHPEIVPCKSLGFCADNWTHLVSTSETPTKAAVQIALEKRMDGLVEAAIRKADNAVFEVEEPTPLRTAVLLAKINRLAEALQCVKEEMGQVFALPRILPHLIYQILCTVSISRGSSVVLDQIVYISTALDGSLSETSESRVINCILTGMRLSKAKRSPSVLNLYSRVSVSPEKKSLFFYLLSIGIGSEYVAGKSALVSLAKNEFGCSSCPIPRTDSVKKELDSVASRDHDFSSTNPAYDYILNNYIHKNALPTQPNPDITISSEIGQYSKQEKGSTYAPEPMSTTCTTESATVIYTADRVTLSTPDSSIEITAILIETAELPTLTITESATTTTKQNLTIIHPIPNTPRYTFFISSSCTIKEVHMQIQDRAFTKSLSVPVQVLPDPVSKKLYAHKHLILPITTTPKHTEKDEIAKAVNKFAGTKHSILSFTPLTIRLTQPHESTTIYKDMSLEWLTLPSVTLLETSTQYTIKPTLNDIILKLPSHAEYVKANTEFILAKPTDSKRIVWVFTDRSKTGVLLL